MDNSRGNFFMLPKWVFMLVPLVFESRLGVFTASVWKFMYTQLKIIFLECNQAYAFGTVVTSTTYRMVDLTTEMAFLKDYWIPRLCHYVHVPRRCSKDDVHPFLTFCFFLEMARHWKAFAATNKNTSCLACLV